MTQYIDPANSPDVVADEAIRLIDTGNAAAAVNVMEDVVRLHPGIDRFHYRLGLAYGGVGDKDRAAREIGTAIRLHPQFPLFHHGLIRLLAADGIERLIDAYGGADRVFALPLDLQIFAIRTLVQARGCLEPVGPLSRAFGERCGGIEVVPEHLGQGVVRITCADNRFFLHIPESVGANWLRVDRLMDYRVYLDRLALVEQPEARSVLFAVDDAPPDDTAQPVMCFSSNRPDDALVPDCAFVASNAYAYFHALAETHRLTWAMRLPAAYWRGVLTGVAGNFEQVLDLPRVRLSRLRHPWLNAAITDTSQYRHLEPELSRRLAVEGCLGAREEQVENFRYRYLIDIDGNTNSWAGLFVKMIAGGCILKVSSPFRQWFYDRLRPGVEYVPVDDPEEDILRRLEQSLRVDEKSQQMGESAQKLASSMTLDSEFSSFLTGWRSLCSK